MEKCQIARYLNHIVRYDGSKYKLIRYVAWRDLTTSKLEHAVVLLDKCKNSTIQVPLEKVEVIEDGIS